jgi:GrpB-like predicted nucleotidyltransferase (UPF0157 family)/GNAT superfamily N-acetyltransferase
MIIRKATSGDTDQLEILFQITRKKAFFYHPKNTFQIGDYVKSTEGENVWVADDSGIIVGFVSTWPADNFIHNLFVHPDFQEKGIGKKLLAVAEDSLKHPMTLKVDMGNLKACRFYESCGWQQVSVHEDAKDPYILYRKNNDYVELVAYDPQWPSMAEDEIEHLKELLPSEHILDIQHVGSTAIPGMIAKPIIDIQIAVDSLSVAKQFAIKILEENGYVFWRDNPDPQRMFFVKGMPPFGKRRTHHVHICEPSYSQWINKILFRDYLIAHPEKAQEYAALKMALLEKHTHDREKYTDAKKEFVEEVLKMASK